MTPLKSARSKSSRLFYDFIFDAHLMSSIESATSTTRRRHDFDHIHRRRAVPHSAVLLRCGTPAPFTVSAAPLLAGGPNLNGRCMGAGTTKKRGEADGRRSCTGGRATDRRTDGWHDISSVKHGPTVPKDATVTATGPRIVFQLRKTDESKRTTAADVIDHIQAAMYKRGSVAVLVIRIGTAIALHCTARRRHRTEACQAAWRRQRLRRAARALNQKVLYLSLVFELAQGHARSLTSKPVINIRASVNGVDSARNFSDGMSSPATTAWVFVRWLSRFFLVLLRLR
jgi:hypothetical protein